MIWAFNISTRLWCCNKRLVKRESEGFTLIELMIVMAIVALLMSFVGPLTMQRYEKAQAVEESLSFKNWLIVNSYRAFATGKGGVFNLSGNSVTFSYAASKTEPAKVIGFTELNDNTEKSQNQVTTIISSRDFNYLFFQPQSITVNSYGIINTKNIEMKLSGEKRNLHINKDSYEYQF